MNMPSLLEMPDDVFEDSLRKGIPVKKQKPIKPKATRPRTPLTGELRRTLEVIREVPPDALRKETFLVIRCVKCGREGNITAADWRKGGPQVKCPICS